MSIFKLIGLLLVIVAAGPTGPKVEIPDGDLRSMLQTSMQNTISLMALVGKQTEMINTVMNKMVEAKEEILELKSKLRESHEKFEKARDAMEEAMEKATKDIQEVGKKLSSSEREISKEISVLNNQQAETTKASQKLSTRVQKVEGTAGSWPEGKYCILASGSCPKNFKRHEAYIKSISTYAANRNYIKQEKFGDSQINCHGNCGQYPNWYADLHIFSCCK